MTTIPVELRPVLSMILNALDRDAQEGKPARGEMADELRALLSEQPQAGAGHQPKALHKECATMPLDERCSECGGETAARHDQGDEVRLYEAVERACGELPDGWTIELHMELGAGWIELYDAEGIQVEDFPTNNERLDYTLNDAIDEALTQSPKGEEE